MVPRPACWPTVLRSWALCSEAMSSTLRSTVVAISAGTPTAPEAALDKAESSIDTPTFFYRPRVIRTLGILERMRAAAS